MAKSLVDKLIKSSQKIHNSLRGSGNYIFVNSYIASILSKSRPQIRMNKIKKIFK